MMRGGETVRRRTTYKRKRFVRGRDRTIGNYLRYTGPQPEQKFLDNDLVDNVISTTASVISSFNLLAQGLTGSTRIGRKITVRKLHVRYELFLPDKLDESVLTSGDIVRVIFFCDKQTNGTATLGADILINNTNYQSYRLLSNQGRFEILMDKFHELKYDIAASGGGADAFAQGGVVRHFSFSKKMSLPIEFSGITGVITEVRSNNLGMLLISSNGIAGMIGKSRIRFSDM